MRCRKQQILSLTTNKTIMRCRKKKPNKKPQPKKKKNKKRNMGVRKKKHQQTKQHSKGTIKKKRQIITDLDDENRYGCLKISFDIRSQAIWDFVPQIHI